MYLHFAALLLGAVQGPSPGSVPLYNDLGKHHHAISSSVPKVQEYFDQGLRLVFGFNHGEAIRAFNEATRLDPKCAICYWGTALAYGPHVNAPMDSASGVAAYAALQKAKANMATASPQEQAYVNALAKRYAAVPPANRASLDSAYARAMGELAKANPRDLDAATLYAEAMMDLRPWNYWKQPSGEPYPGTTEIVAQLERVIAGNPNHPGACHYYIHAVEAVEPQKAVACAERLASLMPGDGHMVHMPAHIYIRVGRYAEAIQSNVHAVHTDETYIGDQKPAGVYPLAYYPHNLHFLAFAATMSGQSKVAIDAARKLGEKTDKQAAKQVDMLQPMVSFLDVTLVTFGKWDDVLRQPVPPAEISLANVMAHYSRGVAFAATGKAAEAKTELAAVQKAAATAKGDGKVVFDIAAHALTGEIAARGGDLNGAITHFEAAKKLEDGILYFEPPTWYYPIRHSLGAVLLKANRAADAEKAYLEDLKRFPENGWALFGLTKALEAQKKTADAAQAEARFKKAWANADVTLVASRF